MKKFINQIDKISNRVYQQLSGMEEKHFQIALGIEFRKNKIDFMREAGLELFYESHPIGLHELDFLIMPCLDLKVPLIIETKLAKLTEEKTRQQLRNYLRSAPLNKNAIIKEINTGLIINFKSNEAFIKESKVDKSLNVELEIWKLEKNKFTQHYSNKKVEEKS
tara:strand:+ start:211 stop:702 length:492 start_codon:yes stop_codon:yes gene_type:complete